MYFLLVSLLLTGFLNAQALLSEDFSSGIMPPARWTALPLTSGWDISSTAMAGGSSPECKFEGFAYNGICRLMSPYTNMTSVDTAVLMFKHFYKRSGSGLTIGLAIANGSTWVSVWEETPLSLISVYPNPAHDQLNISGLVNARLTLYSSTGSVVLQKNNFSGTTLDISHLSHGVYVLDIKTNTNQVIRKKITVL